jgi:hypothetical protein
MLEAPVAVRANSVQMEASPWYLRGWPSGPAVLVSVAVHVCVVAALVSPPFIAEGADPSRILPALYLYAPDRLPAAPREFRIPIPAPIGAPDGLADVAAQATLQGVPGARSAGSKGLPLPGVSEPRLDSVFSVLSVDSEVVRYDWSAAPIYPESLRREGMEGLVEAEFVVDTTGYVDLATVRILRSTRPEFADAVETALAGMQYRPAWRGFHRVRQLVLQRFSFQLVQPPPAAES